MKSAYELREAIGPTLDSIGIDKRTAVLMGGAGLAAYGITSHRGVRTAHLTESGEYAYHPFDVDALLLPDDFEQLRQRVARDTYARPGTTKIDIPPQHPELLPFSGVLFDDVIQEGFASEGVFPVVIGELSILPAAELADQKNDRGEPRDTVGLTMGHKDAYYDGLDVVYDMAWQRQIRKAIARARSLRTFSQEDLSRVIYDFNLPPDFIEAVVDDFQDEAFQLGT